FAAAAELRHHRFNFVLRAGECFDGGGLCDRIGIAAVLALQARGGGDYLFGAGGESDAPSGHRVGFRQRVEREALGLEPRLDLEDVGHRAVVNDVLVNVVGKHPQVGLEQDFREFAELAGRVHGAGRIRGRIQDDAARARGDRATQTIGIEDEAGVLGTLDELGLRTGKVHHRDETDPGGRGDDNFVALVEECGDDVGLSLFAPGRRHDFGDVVIEAVFTLELELDRFFQVAGAGDWRVLGLAGVECAAGGVLDAFRGVEVGLAGGERDDVNAGGLEFGGAGFGGHRGRGFERGDTAIELDHYGSTYGAD